MLELVGVVVVLELGLIVLVVLVLDLAVVVLEVVEEATPDDPEANGVPVYLPTSSHLSASDWGHLACW